MVAEHEHWFVVHCRSSQEDVAKTNLERQGYRVYNPLMRTCDDDGIGKVKPLFPCYIFVCFDPTKKSSSFIRSTRGVIRLVRFGDNCAVVPNEVIAELRKGEDKNGYHIDMSKLFDVDDRVELLSGPFMGMTGTVTEVDSGKGIVVVSLDWIRRLSVSRSAVARI